MKKNELCTTPTSSGILTGVMRTQLMNLIKEKELKIREDTITPQRLSSVREVFVTNAIIGIKPVVEIDGRQISGGEAGNITLMFMDLWKKKMEKLLS